MNKAEKDLNMPSLHYQPLRLLRNVTYPTYQLSAVAGSSKVPPEQVLTIAVLETLSWLRQRFRDFEVPPELDWPASSEYAGVDCRDFVSFTIDIGYRVEVLYLPEEQIWALQLTEPDLGPEPGAAVQKRPPLPGRLFETNIAYRIVAGQVECGFRTFVSDPEETAGSCEVFRIAVVKLLARNPLVGLRQGFVLSDKAGVIDSVASVRSLQEWHKDRARMMPDVVVAECAPEPVDFASMAPLANLPYRPTPDRILMPRKAAVVHPQPKEMKMPVDAAALARYKMGYAQVFVLPLAQQAAFAKITGQAVVPGDILVFEPVAFGGEVVRYPYSRTRENPEAVRCHLEDFLQEYPKHKPMTFGKVVFLPEAKEIYHSKMINLKHTKAELLQAFADKTEATAERHKEELRAAQERCALREDKISRLKGRIEELEEEVSSFQAQSDCQEAGFAARLEGKDAEIARMKALMDRPGRPDEVSGWVGRHFEGKLILHQKAQELMRNLLPNTVDLRLLCDAIEFLATDYLDELTGRIDEDQMNRCCTEKYGRPFTISPVSDVSAAMYPKDYKIKYGVGFTGKPVEALLDLHLCIGVDPCNLIRIYFLFDRTNRLIVVGSLPGHLRTVSYK
ncbi:MAG: hypothetical protein ACYCYM_10145 [Saccharofermentanales bacterium]